MSETALKNRVLKYLNGLPACKAIKIHGSEYMEAGTPDIIGCIKGRFFAIELKEPGKKPEPIQKLRLRQWYDADALIGVAESLDDVESILEGNIIDHWNIFFGRDHE